MTPRAVILAATCALVILLLLNWQSLPFTSKPHQPAVIIINGNKKPRKPAAAKSPVAQPTVGSTGQTRQAEIQSDQNCTWQDCYCGPRIDPNQCYRFKHGMGGDVWAPQELYQVCRQVDDEGKVHMHCPPLGFIQVDGYFVGTHTEAGINEVVVSIKNSAPIPLTPLPVFCVTNLATLAHAEYSYGFHDPIEIQGQFAGLGPWGLMLMTCRIVEGNS